MKKRWMDCVLENVLVFSASLEEIGTKVHYRQTESQILLHHLHGYAIFISVKFATFILALLAGDQTKRTWIQFTEII